MTVSTTPTCCFGETTTIALDEELLAEWTVSVSVPSEYTALASFSAEDMDWDLWCTDIDAEDASCSDWSTSVTVGSWGYPTWPDSMNVSLTDI